MLLTSPGHNLPRRQALSREKRIWSPSSTVGRPLRTPTSPARRGFRSATRPANRPLKRRRGRGRRVQRCVAHFHTCAFGTRNGHYRAATEAAVSSFPHLCASIRFRILGVPVVADRGPFSDCHCILQTTWRDNHRIPSREIDHARRNHGNPCGAGT